MQEKYYLNRLYPLQDKVFAIINKLNTEFYLTGGTALSRIYMDHRYSDDLDFFVNNSKDYRSQVESIYKAIRKEFKNNVEIGITDSTFNRFFINNKNCNLKIDFVNDIAFHYGDFTSSVIFSKVDNIENILSNKLGALSRNEAKDVADILLISMNYKFNWKEIVNASKKKDLWVNPLDVASMLDSFPVQLLNNINWTKPIDLEDFEKILKTIRKDIVLGANNSIKK